MPIEQNWLISQPEIRILRKRTSAILLVIISLLGLLQSFYSFAIFVNNIVYQHYMLYSEVFSLSIGLIEFGLFGWFIWIGTTRHLFARNPVLTINYQGIQIGKLPMVAGDDLFIFWEEIEMIYVRRFWGSTYLSICPKNIDTFLTRFYGWKRFNLYIRSNNPINILQFYLQKSAENTINQIVTTYGSKILEYHIKIRI